MKKALLPLLCCLYGMTAFGADAAALVGPSVNFDTGALWGMRPEYGLDDSGNTNSFENTYWWTFGSGNNLSVVTGYESDVEKYDGFDAKTNPQPSYMNRPPYNYGYAKIASAVPLARTLRVAEASGSHRQMYIPEDNDFFIDTLMKFSEVAADAVDVVNADVDVKDAKFIFGPVQIAALNTNRLVVVCGRYAADGTLYRTNYVTSVAIDPSKWYRVTARAIYTASHTSTVRYDGDLRTYSAFVLYLDGVPVTCDEGDYSIGDDRAQMDVLFAGNEHYAARSLFPMFYEFTSSYPHLRGVAYRGTCELDEYGVVKEGNPLAVPTDSLAVSVARDPSKVTNVTITVTKAGGDSPYFTTNDSASASVVIRVNPSDTVEVSALAKDGYVIGEELELSGNNTCCDDLSGHTITFASSFDDASQLAVTVPVSGAFFKVGDDVYETMAEAIDDARERGISLIQLAASVTLEREAASDNGQMRVLADDNFVFDLHGHVIKGDHFREEALLYAQGRLTVYDSVGDGGIEAPGAAIEVVSDNDAVEVNHEHAKMVLGDEKVTNQFTVKGRVRCTEGELEIKGGTYLTPKSESSESFYLARYVDTERFDYSEDGEELGIGKYWKVVYGGKLEVLFESAEGFGFDPYRRVVSPGGTIDPPTLLTNGYTVTRWYRKSDGSTWTFDMPVNESMTLVAETALETFAITYPAGYEYPPYSYTLETPKTYLRSPSRTHFTFAGWRATNQNHLVNCVGLGAHYMDAPTCVVTGNLTLAATWTADPQKWTNADHGQSESNGVYSGEFSLALSIGDNSFYRGDKVIIDEIAFSIVNPLLYPKTAEYLSIRTPAGTSTSMLRDDHAAALSLGMLLGTDALANGRPRVAYKFPTGVEVTCGTTNYVYFSTSDGTRTSGILRLVRKPNADDRAFGNCSASGGAIERYREYCPVYEVTGHAPEGGDGD